MLVPLDYVEFLAPQQFDNNLTNILVGYKLYGISYDYPRFYYGPSHSLHRMANNEQISIRFDTEVTIFSLACQDPEQNVNIIAPIEQTTHHGLLVVLTCMYTLIIAPEVQNGAYGLGGFRSWPLA